MLFYADQDKHASLDAAMADLDAFPFEFKMEEEGSKLSMLKVEQFLLLL